MELINLERILSSKTKQLIDCEVSAFAAGQKYKIIHGQASLGFGYIDNRYDLLNNIIDIVSIHYNVDRGMMLAKTRKEPFVIYRQITHYLARKYTTLDLGDIGRMVGNVTHATVINSIKVVPKYLKDIYHANKIDIIEQKILLTTEI